MQTLPRCQLELESIDDDIKTAEATATTAVNEIPLSSNDDSTSGDKIPVTIYATQCYIASEHSYEAKPSQDNHTIGAGNSDAGIWLKFKCCRSENLWRRWNANRQAHSWRLLKDAFPDINGLQLTLLQDKESTTNCVQILHVNNNHRVCAASMTSEENHVNINLWRMLRAVQFWCSMCNVKFVDVTGSTDCGLFANAHAITIWGFSRKSQQSDRFCH